MAANSDGIRKGFQIQLAAFQRFAARHKDAYLALFTVADSVNGLPLEQMVSDLGIGDRVVFMPSYEQVTGLTPESMLAAWYNSLDVLSLCSYGEGFGLPLIEAQACGTPVVASRGSAMTELASPAGWTVKTRRFWNISHRAWWYEPDEEAIVKAWSLAYHERGTNAATERSLRARAFALDYDVRTVRDRHWAPFMDQIETGLDYEHGPAMNSEDFAAPVMEVTE
jgi:glycosyltransferase involved in cell wall biosynthesis